MIKSMISGAQFKSKKHIEGSSTFNMQKGEDNMYLIRKNSKMNLVPDTLSLEIESVSDIINVFDSGGEEYRNLFDFDVRLSGGRGKYLGFQVTIVQFKVSEYRSHAYDAFVNPGTPFGQSFYFIPGGVGTKLSKYVNDQPATAKIKLIFDEYIKHDISQYGNTEFLGQPYEVSGHNMESMMMTITSRLNMNTPEFGQLEFITVSTDDEFLNTSGVTERQIPVIGSTIVGTYASIARSRLMYFVTPTIYDIDGNIVELEREDEQDVEEIL